MGEPPQARDAHGGVRSLKMPFPARGTQVFLFNKAIAIQLAHGDPLCNIGTASLPQHLPKLSPRLHASMFLTGTHKGAGNGG